MDCPKCGREGKEITEINMGMICSLFDLASEEQLISLKNSINVRLTNYDY